MMMIFTLFADRPDQSKPLTHKDILDGLGYPNNNDEQMTDVNFARLQPLILDACDEKTELVDQKQVTVYQLKKIYADLQETTANKQEFVSACYISLAMEINRGMPTLVCVLACMKLLNVRSHCRNHKIKSMPPNRSPHKLITSWLIYDVCSLL